MTPALKSLLRAARFLAFLGLLALSFTEEIAGLWLYTSWFMLAFSLAWDRYPQLQRPLRRWETMSVICLVGLTVLDFMVLKNSIFIVVAHFLLALQTLKFVGLKERKDSLQIGLIGFFQLLAGCTLSADMWQAVLLVLLIPGTTALLFWNYAARVQEEAGVQPSWPDASLKQLHRNLSIAALPLNIALTAIVFILFPRLTFNVRVPGFGAGRSAYSDQMNLEQTGAVARDRSAAAWMGFADDTQRGQWSGYLRGDVMDTFDGKQWFNAHLEKARIFQPDGNGVFKLRVRPPESRLLHATLTLLNTAKSTLFTPGTPIEVTVPFSHLQLTDAGEAHWNSALQHPLQYQLLFIAGERRDEPDDAASLPNIYTQLPSDGFNRTRALSDRIAGHGSAVQKAHALERYLRDHYQYTLNFGGTVPDNPIDFFLFESRRGFCIHFAAALAVMLRLEHIPSRVVAGYYHGEWNPFAQEILFREQDAHAWVEAWVDQHWITLDPSPRAALESMAGAQGRLSWLRLRETWDYLGYRWDRLIIEYDLYAQLRAWEQLRSRSDHMGVRWTALWTQWRSRTRHPEQTTTSSIESPDEKSGPHWLRPMTVGMGLSFLIAGWAIVKRSSKSAVPIFYLRFLRRMARSGFAKNPAETAAEFAQRATRHLPKQAPRIQEITNAYYRLRFGKK